MTAQRDYEKLKEQTEGKKYFFLDLDIRSNEPIIKEVEFGEVKEINKHTSEFFYTKGGWFYARDLRKLLKGHIITDMDNLYSICLTKVPLIGLLKYYVDKYSKEIEAFETQNGTVSIIRQKDK